MAMNNEDAVLLLEILIVGVPFIVFFTLAILRSKGENTKHTIISTLLASLSGLFASLIVMMTGVFLNVNGYPLWIATAIGVILGIEVYQLNINLLANRGHRWAKRLRYMDFFQ